MRKTRDQREEIRGSYGDQLEMQYQNNFEWNCSRWLKLQLKKWNAAVLMLSEMESAIPLYWFKNEADSF